MYLNHLTSATKGIAVLCTICGLCIGWAERDRHVYAEIVITMTQSGIFEQDFFFLVKILAWVLGDLSSKPDVPQHVGERVSKSLNYPVPYFCLQTVSNIHPILCLRRAPQSLAKNLLRSIHIKGLNKWKQWQCISCGCRGQVLCSNSHTNVNKTRIYFTSSGSTLGLQKRSGV